MDWGWPRDLVPGSTTQARRAGISSSQSWARFSGGRVARLGLVVEKWAV